MTEHSYQYDDKWEHHHDAPAQALSRLVDVLYTLGLDDDVTTVWDEGFTDRMGSTWKELNRSLVARGWV